jgi:hypothetical protein
MLIRRLRRALLISVTVLAMLMALPAATIARAHRSSSCHVTTTHAKHGARKCARPAHKAKPTHHPAQSRHKHKAKSHRTAEPEEAEDESEAACEEGAVEASSSDGSSAACEAPEEEQES